MFASGKKNSDLDRTESRKQQVLAAAAECFTRRGFHGASMAEVAKAANMSVGHIYHYFDNKEAIIAGIVEKGLKELIDMMDGLSSQQDVLQAALDQSGKDFLSGDIDKHDMLAIEVLAEASRNPKVAAVIIEADKTCRAKLRQLVAAAHRSPLSADDLDARVEISSALFDGLKLRALRNPDLNRKAMLPVLRAALKSILE